jgi:sugar phosphate isomerase/epimerase
MIKSAVTISLVPQAKGGPFVFWDDLAKGAEQAAALGFDAIEIFPPGAEAIDPPALRALLERLKLKLAALGTGAGWVIHKFQLCHPEVSVRERAREFIRRIIDAAGPFGAPAIIGSMQGRWEGPVTRDQALVWLGEALNDLGEYARRHGVPLLYEPLNRYETNLFNRAADVTAYLQGLSTRNVKVLADLFHMNIEEVSLADALRTYGPALGHVHFVDSNRRAAGMGHIDYAPVAQALRDLGYQGYASAEVLPLPDSETAARQTIQSFQQLFPTHA